MNQFENETATKVSGCFIFKFSNSLSFNRLIAKL